MTTYLWIKLLHIVSATLLFGTGLGSAFFMRRAYLGGDIAAFKLVARNVVLADYIFTAPAVVIQLATGLWMALKLNVSPTSTWFLLVIGLYVFVGICWLPVVWIQIRVRDLLQQEAPHTAYAGLMRVWTILGFFAFTSVLVLFYLMVSKVGMY